MSDARAVNKREASPLKSVEADDNAGFLLWKLTVLWQQKLSSVFAAFGVTPTQFAILASLRYFEERRHVVSQVLLADHARLEPMTLSKAIRKLEEDGMVLREPSTSDSRAMVVRLTAQGRRVTQKAVVAVERADDEFFGVLTARQLASYKALMVVLIARK